MFIDKLVVIEFIIKIFDMKNIFLVENVLIFLGCENFLINDERKVCLNDKINMFISWKFNIDKFLDKYVGKKNRIDV